MDVLSIGVDRIQRNFEPIKKQVETWKASLISDDVAKLVIYRAFVEDGLDAPKHLAHRVHEQYFNPPFEEFAPRTMWSLSNAFTSAFMILRSLHHAQHYLGFTDDLDARTWDGDRKLEHKLKKRKNGRKLCPICLKEKHGGVRRHSPRTVRLNLG